MKAVFHHSNDDPALHERIVGDAANLLDGVSLVPSGVGERTRLESAGYADITT